MSDDEDVISVTVKMTRGSGTDDRDTLKATVSAPDVHLLNERVEDVKQHMESWADDLRDLQPEQGRSTTENQQDLGSVKA